MQFVELRTVTRDTIMEAFRIHKHMLGVSNDVNRANAEAAAYSFARWIVVPRLERIKAALNTVFLPMFGAVGESVEFDYESPVDDDESAKNAKRDSVVKAVVDLVTAGFDADDVLRAYDMPDMKFERPEPPAPTGGTPNAEGSKPVQPRKAAESTPQRD
jgi:hypothetical protein